MSTSSIDQIIEQITKFLRDHGYKIIRDDKEKTMYAQHPEKLNIVVRAFSQLTIITALCECNETAKRDRLGYLECINIANKQGVIARCYADEKLEHSFICIEICYLGEYKEAEFRRVWNWMEGDIGRMIEIPGFEKYLG